MTNLTWSATRATTIDRFNGQTPRPEDEAAIIDVFEVHPQLVLRAIDEIAQALDQGKITWAWSTLRARLQRGTTALRDATANTSADRQRHITNARNWINNAGIHYDRASDVEAELFGDDTTKGRLHDYRNDPAIRQQLLDHWQEQRPRGQQAEQDHQTWTTKCKADRALIIELKRKALDELAAKHTDPQPAQTAATSSDDIDF